jgi:FixJ family two-component response regulator
MALSAMMAKPRIRVAIVDDDASVRQALRRLLNAASFEAVSYSSGSELFEDLNEFQPCCIILDMHMPGLGGLDIQRHLKSVKNDTPVIIITGHNSAKAREEAFILGARSYFAKPVEGDILIAEIIKLTHDLHTVST